jgi:hypothetical protein
MEQRWVDNDRRKLKDSEDILSLWRFVYLRSQIDRSGREHGLQRPEAKDWLTAWVMALRTEECKMVRASVFITLRKDD